jgi:hypothetical protein
MESELKYFELNTKALGFRDLKDYYQHMCKVQLAHLKSKLGPHVVDEFQKKNFFVSSFDPNRTTKPLNFKNMVEIQRTMVPAEFAKVDYTKGKKVILNSNLNSRKIRFWLNSKLRKKISSRIKSQGRE